MARYPTSPDVSGLYVIRVAGNVEAGLALAFDGLAVIRDADDVGNPITSLMGNMDQTALAGVLDALFSHCYTVISVQAIDLG